MSRFNLLREPWISVMEQSTGRQKDVSVLELFQNAQDYSGLAGDMETQDFSILRLLLAVLQTVFSRFDESGNPLPGITLDEKLKQTIPVDEDDYDDYAEAAETTWKMLWQTGRFPKIVSQYLTAWEDRFYLFDNQYPFYQCTKEEIEKRLPAGKKPSPVFGKYLKRLISESENKTALFSPQSEKYKDLMTEAELARWMVMFQNYTGTSDKTSLSDKNRKSSKGWLYDLGGLYLEGNNLFETLMMNYIPVHSEPYLVGTIQIPCWELSGEENLERLISIREVDNLAELYTNWSRALYMAPSTDIQEAIRVGIAKVPELRHADQFLEPMTIWRFNDTGDNKNHYTPRKHMSEQAMWRSFGLIALKNSDEKHQHQPEILKQYGRVRKVAGSRQITLHAVSMKDDGNTTSRVPTDEITDVLHMNDIVLSDTGKDGWVVRINDEVEFTKKQVDIFGGLLSDIVRIRGMDPKKEGENYIRSGKREAYQRIDAPFREWIGSIQPEDSMEQKMLLWQEKCRKIILQQAQEILENAGERDRHGITDKENRVINIFTAYLAFRRRLKRSK